MGGERVSRLIYPEPAAAWQADIRQTAPGLVGDWALDLDSLAFEPCDCGVDVFAEQVEFLAAFSGSAGCTASSAGESAKISQPSPASTEQSPSTSLKKARSASASLLKMFA
jgi:hypothetical protein